MTWPNIGVSPEVAIAELRKIFGGPTGRDLTRATWLLGKGEQLHVGLNDLDDFEVSVVGLPMPSPFRPYSTWSGGCKYYLTIRNREDLDCAVRLLRPHAGNQVLQERANANGKQLGCASNRSVNPKTEEHPASHEFTGWDEMTAQKWLPVFSRLINELCLAPNTRSQSFGPVRCALLTHSKRPDGTVSIKLDVCEDSPSEYHTSLAGFRVCYSAELAGLLAVGDPSYDPADKTFIFSCRSVSPRSVQSQFQGSGKDPTIPSSSPTDLATHELDSLIGMASVKNEVRRFEAFLNIQEKRRRAGLPANRQTLHFVFHGNPGTGKTTVARIIGKILRRYEILKSGHVVETDRSGLVAGYVGQTAIKTDAKIKDAMDGILFIDEAYSLTDRGAQDFGQEAVDTLLKRMEDLRDRLVVIVAGYPEKMAHFIASNPGLESRFTRFLCFPDYSVEELHEIFVYFARSEGYIVQSEALAPLRELLASRHAARSSRFGNAREVRNLFEEAITRQALRLSALERCPSQDELQTLMVADIP